MPRIEIVDVTDESAFGQLPPCADPAFDHRTCDYWEDADRGSKAHRPGWLKGSGHAAAGAPAPAVRSGGGPANRFAPSGETLANPFAPPPGRAPNPFAPPGRSNPNPFAPAPASPARNPFLDEAGDDALGENPFAPKKPSRPAVAADAPRKLQLLGRGLGVFGSYAKVLLADGEPAGYCQFGPLSAYPRALRLRELYPQLPDAPLPAVVTCIATTEEARRHGYAVRLVEEVCRDLAARGFSAVEAYPEAHEPENATPAARPEFWLRCGFALVVDDERFPVLRREL